MQLNTRISNDVLMIPVKVDEIELLESLLLSCFLACYTHLLNTDCDTPCISNAVIPNILTPLLPCTVMLMVVVGAALGLSCPPLCLM